MLLLECTETRVTTVPSVSATTMGMTGMARQDARRKTIPAAPRRALHREHDGRGHNHDGAYECVGKVHRCNTAHHYLRGRDGKRHHDIVVVCTGKHAGALEKGKHEHDERTEQDCYGRQCPGESRNGQFVAYGCAQRKGEGGHANGNCTQDRSLLPFCAPFGVQQAIEPEETEKLHPGESDDPATHRRSPPETRLRDFPNHAPPPPCPRPRASPA